VLWEGAEKVDVVFATGAEVAFATVVADVDGFEKELLLPLLPRATTSVWNIIRLQHNRARTHF
jgi:hypothetical protein